MEVAAGTHMGNTGRWKPKIAPSTYSLRGKEDLDNESSILFNEWYFLYISFIIFFCQRLNSRRKAI